MSTKHHILHCQSKQKPKVSSFSPLLHARNDDSWIHFKHKTNSFPLLSNYSRTQTIITNQSNAKKKKKNQHGLSIKEHEHKKKIAMATQILPFPTTLSHTHTHSNNHHQSSTIKSYPFQPFSCTNNHGQSSIIKFLFFPTTLTHKQPRPIKHNQNLILFSSSNSHSFQPLSYINEQEQ